MPEDRVRLVRELFLRSFLGGPAGPSTAMLDRLSGALDEREVAAGDVLFREGDVADRLYFVSSGKVRMSREGHRPYLYSGRWIVGGIDVLNQRPRRRTATVLTDASILSVRGDDWFDTIEETMEVSRDVIAMQLAGTSRHIARLAPDPFEPPRPSSPPPLHRLSLFDRLMTFFDGNVLRRAGVQTLSILAEVCEEVRLGPGEALIGAQTQRDHVYIVAHGAIETHHVDPVMHGTFGRSSIVASVCATSLGWSAHAKEPSLVLALPIEEWLDAMSYFDLFRCTMAWAGLERERVTETLAERATSELVLE
jgi:CRP-like cAMP-binding protein